MHPSLKLSLDKFPAGLRARVKGAYQGSSSDLDFLLHQLAEHHLSDRLCRLLLPVWYAALAPPEPPEEYDLDAPVGLAQLRRGLTAFRGVLNSSAGNLIERGAIPEVWARVYPWLQAFDILGDHAPEFRIPHQQLIGIIHSMIKNSDDRMMDTVKATPGIIPLLGKAWKALLAGDNLEDLETLSLHLRMVMTSNTAETIGMIPDKDFNELLDALDGDYAVLSDAITLHLRRMTPVDELATADQRVLVAKLATDLLMPRFDDNMDLREALLSSKHGFVQALTRFVFFVRSPWDTSSKAHDHFATLMAIFADPHQEDLRGRSHIYFLDSMQAGLIENIAVFANERLTSELTMGLSQLFEAVLCRHTIYHSVLPSLKQKMPVFVPIGRNRNLGPVVKSFQSLLLERLSQYDAYEAQRKEHLRACAAVECGKTLRLSALKRCGGCTSVFYCSSQCQKRHWRAVHRSSCSELREMRSVAVSRFGARNISFMRFLCFSEFQKAQAEATTLFLKYLIQGKYIRRSSATAGTEDVTLVVFDFTRGTAHVSVERPGDTAWLRIPALFLEQAKRHAGRVHLHVFLQSCLALHRRAQPTPEEEAKIQAAARDGQPFLHAHVFPFYLSAKCAELFRQLRGFIMAASEEDLLRMNPQVLHTGTETMLKEMMRGVY
ncbi:hypothetical protein HMN09_00919800 [Mycena chlorophos]|uniref:MYND-type domain-containing protein n=1 Tax=Mycena chlorophos TaxID=658473 RepID=A0A8H6SIL4_MYCCL|nr:hypothetical protein HMN09_00919800 [Mycena chlorophos]